MATKDQGESKTIRPQVNNPRINSVQAVIFVLIFTAGVVLQAISGSDTPYFALPGLLLALFFGASPRIAAQWEKAVVLRLGKLHKVAGPGLFWTFPIIDSVSSWIDQRVMTTTFKAEQTLTKDTVPVDVDAVLFWVVWDPQKASMEVANYSEAVSWAAQTALRDMIGKTMLAEMLAGRDVMDKALREMIDARTEPWGVAVQSVEIRDVVIPGALQDAMSRQAQAERERQARIILGQAEAEVAQKFLDAAKVYGSDPVAFQLRAMNILYEGMKEKGALVVVPSTAAEAMGGVAQAAAIQNFMHQKGIAGGDDKKAE